MLWIVMLTSKGETGMFRPRYGYNSRTGWRTPTQPVEEGPDYLWPPTSQTWQHTTSGVQEYNGVWIIGGWGNEIDVLPNKDIQITYDAYLPHATQLVTYICGDGWSESKDLWTGPLVEGNNHINQTWKTPSSGKFKLKICKGWGDTDIYTFVISNLAIIYL